MLLGPSQTQKVLEAMEAKAKELGLKRGVSAIMAVFPGSNPLDPVNTINWLTTDGTFFRLPDAEGQSDNGTNYLAVVLGKLAEMFRTGLSSGTSPAMKGELGYRGGIVVNSDALSTDGYVYYLAYSGGTEEQDVLIAEAGKAAALAA